MPRKKPEWKALIDARVNELSGDRLEAWMRKFLEVGGREEVSRYVIRAVEKRRKKRKKER